MISWNVLSSHCFAGLSIGWGWGRVKGYVHFPRSPSTHHTHNNSLNTIKTLATSPHPPSNFLPFFLNICLPGSISLAVPYSTRNIYVVFPGRFVLLWTPRKAFEVFQLSSSSGVSRSQPASALEGHPKECNAPCAASSRPTTLSFPF